MDPALAERIQGVAARDRNLPLCPDLHPTLGASLQRGITVAVGGQGTATTPATAAALALALAAGPSAGGSWVAAVGLPDLGLVAAAEAGIALNRFALVPHMGRRPGVGMGPHAPEEGGAPGSPPGRATWADVVAALIDGFDMVLARPPAHLKPGVARRLVARARERQAVLVGVGGWPEGASMRIDVSVSKWVGLHGGPDGGAGHLQSIHRDLRPTGRIFRTDRPVSAAGSPRVRSA